MRYKKVVAESRDQHLRLYYQQLVSQSQRFSHELNYYLLCLGDTRETDNTLKGKLYRRLMKANAAVTGHDEKTILATDLHGEQWAIAAYEKALENGTLTSALRPAISHQLAHTKQTYQNLQELHAQKKAAHDR